MIELLFIRHAETDMAGTFCGHSDPPINASGLLQITALVEGLRDEDLDVVYSSDLRRARETADAIAAAFKIPCISRSAWREIHFGKWEGLTWAEIGSIDAPYAQRWLDSYPSLSTPEGEQFEMFEARVQAEIQLVKNQLDFRRIAIVTHAGVMRTILRTHCGVTEDDCWARTKSYCANFRLSSGRNDPRSVGA